MSLLPLNPDELLSTTRAVRKRLDFDKPVPDALIRECVAMAQQSPSGSNNPSMSFVIVKDAAKRKAVGAVYRECFELYKTWDGRYIGSIEKATAEENAQQQRIRFLLAMEGHLSSVLHPLEEQYLLYVHMPYLNNLHLFSIYSFQLN